MTYLWLDATYVKVREDGRVQSMALVISDAHVGVKGAISRTLAGATWQRCRVHFMRNLLALIPKTAQPVMAALVWTIFVEADLSDAKSQLGQVAETLLTRYPKAADLLASAEEDILAYFSFPEAHRKRLHFTNPLERLHKEVKRRANVVGIFPNRFSVLRLVGALLMEQNNEWAVGRRYFSTGSMAAATAPGGSSQPALAEVDVAAS